MAKHDANAIAKEIAGKIIKNGISFGNAISVVQEIMKNLEVFKGLTGEEKHAITLTILDEIAKGKDGIIGTEDDLIPEHILKGIKALIENDLINSTISLIKQTMKGELKAETVKKCFGNMTGCVFAAKN
jgi:hypothetical protein